MTLILIDVSGWIYASHFRNPTLSKADGTPTGATFGFCNMLWRFLREPPIEFSHIAAVYDPQGATWRSSVDPGYKANRGSKPGAMTAQWQMVRDVSDALNVARLEAPGFEADDVIATYARRGKAAGLPVVIVSGDKDLYQLLDAPDVRIYDSHPKHRESRWITEAIVYAKFGVRPRLVPDVQALAGDGADGYKGVPRIGPKTGGELVGRYGSLEAVITEAKNRNGSFMSPRIANLIANNAEKALMTRKLATLDRAADVFVPLDDLVARPADTDRLCAFLDSIESRELRDRVLREAPMRMPA